MSETITTLSHGGANAYLVRGHGGSILVDTLTEPYRDAVLDACRDQDVKLIFLTHGHFDHCQNAACLAEAFGCPVGIGEADVPLLAQGAKRRVGGRGWWGTVYAAAANHNITHKNIPPVKPEVILRPDMSLREYGVEGRVAALPGHTAGSVGLLLDVGGFFVGDAMQSIGGASCAWCYEDRERALQSVRRIRGSRAQRLYYGHGKSTGNA